MLTSKTVAFWYPVLTDSDISDLPETWQKAIGPDVSQFNLVRSSMLERAELFVSRSGCTLTIVRATPRYMKEMVSSAGLRYTADNIQQCANAIANLPRFSSERVYDCE